MNSPEPLLTDVLSRAIADLRASNTDVFTFAFYHDHESATVSICVDTEPSSTRAVHGENAFAASQFASAVAQGNLRMAALFRANPGRNLSLGSFELVNLARTPIGTLQPDDHFYLSMIRTLRAHEREILSLSRDPDRVLFCTSSADAEVGYLWMPHPARRQ